MKDHYSFVAIDFEHLTSQHESACAVGMVKVINNVIVEEFYSLIKPVTRPEDLRNGVSGITEEMCLDAPLFPEVWQRIKEDIGDLPLVAHNRHTEKNVIQKTCIYYDLDYRMLDTALFFDTYEMTGITLEESCLKYDILLSEHHNPLDDARACAMLYLKLKESDIVLPHPKIQKKSASGLSQDELLDFKQKQMQKKENEDVYTPLSDDEVEHKDTPFFGKFVLITGEFKKFPNRERDLGGMLKTLGARNLKSYNKKVEILIAGKSAGPSKLAKAKADGKQIISEEELYSIIASATKN